MICVLLQEEKDRHSLFTVENSSAYTVLSNSLVPGIPSGILKKFNIERSNKADEKIYHQCAVNSLKTLDKFV